MVDDHTARPVGALSTRCLLIWGLALVWATFGVTLAMKYTNDDAYITFRYSWNLAHGRGAVMNAGEYVEGYTNFLWMLIVAGWIRLIDAASAPQFAKYLGASCAVAAVAMVAWQAWAIARIDHARSPGVWQGPFRPTGDRMVLLGGAPLLMAANTGVWINATSGLETGLLLALVCLATALDLDEIRCGRWRPGIVAWIFAAATRPEMVLLAPMSRLCFLPARRRRRAAVSRTVRDAILFAVVVGGVWIWRRSYYGEWLPNTYYAKMGGLLGVTSAQYYWTYLRLATGHFLLPLVVVPLVAVRGTQPWLVYLGGTLVVGSAIVFKEGADGMPACRLLIPYCPHFALLLAWGLEQCWGAIQQQRYRLRLGLSLMLLAAAVAGAARAGLVTGMYLNWIYQRERGYREGHEQLATWLGERAAPGDAVGLMDIGIVGYRNPDLFILDTSGLTDRFIGKSPGRFLAKRYPTSYVFEEHRPRFLVVCLRQPPKTTGGRPWYDVDSAWTPADRDLLVDSALSRDYAYRRTFRHLVPVTPYFLVVFERRGAGGAALE